MMKNIEGLPSIVIHIGAPKTGSSAIQNICLKNINMLEKYGYYYPVHGEDLNGISGGHGQISSNLFLGERSNAKNWFDKEFDNAKNKNLKLLISAEGLYQNCAGLDYVLQGRRALIISYLRNPIESVVSNYNQGVKRAFYTKSLFEECDDLLQRPTPEFNSGRIFKQWFEVFDKNDLSIRPFEKSIFNGGTLVCDFFSQLGFAKDEIESLELPPKRINDSYKPSVLNLKRVLNSVLDKTQVSKNALIDEMLQKYSGEMDERGLSAVTLLGGKLYRKMHDFFESDVEWLRKEVFENSPADLWSLPKSFKNEDMGCGSVYSLEYVYTYGLMHSGEADNYVRSCVSSCKGSVGFLPDCISLLPHLLSDKYKRQQERNISKATKELIARSDRFLNNTAEKADLYREIAFVYEGFGEYHTALALIEKALSERPDGLELLKAGERLKCLVS